MGRERTFNWLPEIENLHLFRKRLKLVQRQEDDDYPPIATDEEGIDLPIHVEGYDTYLDSKQFDMELDPEAMLVDHALDGVLEEYYRDYYFEEEIELMSSGIRYDNTRPFD
jgi:hypothetical protein